MEAIAIILALAILAIGIYFGRKAINKAPDESGGDSRPGPGEKNPNERER